MRIISGKFKGRKLLTPNSNLIRPTSDRAKETIFNGSKAIETAKLDTGWVPTLVMSVNIYIN